MNIRNLLIEINKKMSDEKIGKRIGASQSKVNRLRNSVTERIDWDTGSAIVKLAREVIPEHIKD
jgi:DNA-binding Xre family transcriptional regulator